MLRAKASEFWGCRVQEFWGLGVLEFWGFWGLGGLGVLGFRALGFQGIWGVRVRPTLLLIPVGDSGTFWSPHFLRELTWNHIAPPSL